MNRSPTPPSTAVPIAILLAQHDDLRSIMAHCEALADEVDADREVITPLVREVARLRSAFKAHCRSEQQLFDLIGRGRASFVEHDLAHRVALSRLGTSVTGELRAAIENIRAHIALEERALVSVET